MALTVAQFLEKWMRGWYSEDSPFDENPKDKLEMKADLEEMLRKAVADGATNGWNGTVYAPDAP